MSTKGGENSIPQGGQVRTSLRHGRINLLRSELSGYGPSMFTMERNGCKTDLNCELEIEDFKMLPQELMESAQ